MNLKLPGCFSGVLDSRDYNERVCVSVCVRKIDKVKERNRVFVTLFHCDRCIFMRPISSSQEERARSTVLCIAAKQNQNF